MKTFLRIISFLFLAAAIFCVVLAFFKGLAYLIFGFGYLCLRDWTNAYIDAIKKEERSWER